MRIGLINQLHGAPDTPRPTPTWASISERARVAEFCGFDTFVFEDALLYRDSVTEGGWESFSIAAALAATTSTIEIGQSVVNAPYRSPALTAKMAETIDEISGGRYIFGLGAGNTDDSDYEAFGFPTDRRYSRFAEAIAIIHGLLKNGAIDYDGQFHSARRSELVLRGPRSGGPPIVIAGGAPKMLRLVARYADGWNWWTGDHGSAAATLGPIVDELEIACQEVGRDPASLFRTLDVYSVDAMNVSGSAEVISGPPEHIAETLLSFGDLGFDEVRCDVYPKTIEAIEAMAKVVQLVHAA